MDKVTKALNYLNNGTDTGMGLIVDPNSEMECLSDSRFFAYKNEFGKWNVVYKETHKQYVINNGETVTYDKALAYKLTDNPVEQFNTRLVTVRNLSRTQEVNIDAMFGDVKSNLEKLTVKEEEK